MQPVAMMLLWLVTFTQASTPKVFAVDAPPSAALHNVTAVQPLPTAQKMTLAEYFEKRMRLLSQGQVHQRHTLLTPAELARDFNNWDSGSDELKTIEVHHPIRRMRPKPRSRVRQLSIPTTTTTSTTTTTETIVPKKPLPNAMYSSSLDAMMMNRQSGQSAASSFGSRRVIPINWEDELTEWDPSPRRRPYDSPPGRDRVVFKGGGGGLEPSIKNYKRKYTHASNFRRKRPQFQPTSRFFSLERRPDELEDSFARSRSQEVPSTRRFRNFEIEGADFGGDPTNSDGHHPNFGNEAISFGAAPISSEGFHRDFETDFTRKSHNSHKRLNPIFENEPVAYRGNPISFGGSFRGFKHDVGDQSTLDDPHRSNRYIEFDSKEPPPNAEGIIPHASPELRWEDGTLIDPNNDKFQKLGIQIPDRPRTQGGLNLNKLPFLGPVQFSSSEFGKGVNHKEYKDPTQNADITIDKPPFHHPSLGNPSNELKQDSDGKNYPGFRRSLETKIISLDANYKDGAEKKIEEEFHYHQQDTFKNFEDDSSKPIDSTIFYLNDENKHVGTDDAFVEENPKVTVIYGPLIEDNQFEEKPEKRNSAEIKLVSHPREQNQYNSKETLEHDHVDLYVRHENKEDFDENKYPEKHADDERYMNHRYDPSSQQREKNTEEKRSRSREKTYHGISEGRENGQKKGRVHYIPDDEDDWKKLSRNYDISDHKEDERKGSRNYDISNHEEDERKRSRNYDISDHKGDKRKGSGNYDISYRKEDERNESKNYDISNHEEDERNEKNYDISNHEEDERKRRRNYDISDHKEDERKGNRNYDISDYKEDERKGNRNYDISYHKEDERKGNINYDISDHKEDERNGNRNYDISADKGDRRKGNRNYDISADKEDRRKGNRNYDISVDKEDRRKGDRNYDISADKEDGRKGNRNYDISVDKEDRRKGNRNYDISVDKEDRRKGNRNYDISADKEDRREGNRNYDISVDKEDDRKQSWEFKAAGRSSDSQESFNPYKGFKLYDHHPKSYDSKELGSSKEAKLRPASRYESREVTTGKISSVETPYYSSKFASKSSEDVATRRSSSKSREADDLSVHHIAGPPYHDAIPLDGVKTLSQEEGLKFVTKIKSRELPKIQISYKSAADDFDDPSIFSYDEQSRSTEEDKSILVPNNTNLEAKDPFRWNNEFKKTIFGEKHFGEVVEIFPDHVDYEPPQRKRLNAFDDDEFHHNFNPNTEEFGFTKDKGSDSKLITGDDFKDDFGRPPTFDFSFSNDHFDEPFFKEFDDYYSSEDKNIDDYRSTFPRFKNRERRRRLPKRKRTREHGRFRPSPVRVPNPPPQITSPVLRIPKRKKKINGVEIYRVPTNSRNKDLIAIKVNEFTGNGATSQFSTSKFGQRLPLEPRSLHPTSGFPRANRLLRGRRRGPSPNSRFFGIHNNIPRRFQDNTDPGPQSPSDASDDYNSYNYDYEDTGLHNDRLTSPSLLRDANSYSWNDRNAIGVDGMTDDRRTDDGNVATGRRNGNQWSIGGLFDLGISGDIGRNVHRILG